MAKEKKSNKESKKRHGVGLFFAADAIRYHCGEERADQNRASRDDNSIGQSDGNVCISPGPGVVVPGPN